MLTVNLKMAVVTEHSSTGTTTKLASSGGICSVAARRFPNRSLQQSLAPVPALYILPTSAIDGKEYELKYGKRARVANRAPGNISPKWNPLVACIPEGILPCLDVTLSNRCHK